MSANLQLLPWVRQGAATAIAIPELLGTQPQSAVASVDITLKVNDSPLPKTTVQLRGPADVIGIDPHQIVRTDPRPASNDFEPNCFPSVEFDRPDLPWLFTPLSANAESKLRPWLCLVVVRQQDGVTLGSAPGSPLPELHITTPAEPFVELPDLTDSWAWAHAQVAALDGTPPIVAGALDGAPHLSLSRLICPRALVADTSYIACVVPAFEVGRRTGLGINVSDTDVTQLGLAPAWTLGAGTPADVKLPVYFSWEFRTGPGGDFATLARKLKGEIPEGLGRREVNVRDPGFELPPDFPDTAIVEFCGALQPMSAPPQPVLWADAFAEDFEEALAPIVNSTASGPNEPPLLAPPLYGRWHAGRSSATVGAENWFDELNLDPRWRATAALGTRVIQEHQEALMASAWNQAAQMQTVNQRIRQFQLSMAVGESLYARHLTAIATRLPNNEEMLLRFATPAFGRIRTSAGRTIIAQMENSRLPVGATRTAMRRIGRQRGPLTRRLVAKGSIRPAANTWVARLNYGGSAAPPTRPIAVFAKPPAIPTTQEVTAAVWNRGFTIAPENRAIPTLPTVDLLPGDWDYPGHFRSAVFDHLKRLRPRPPGVAQAPPVTLSPTATLVLQQMNPRSAVANLAQATIALGDPVLQPAGPGVTPVGTETVMITPTFPQPMYQPLAELSQDYLLPGLDTVKPDTVLGLETNRAFVEAYMIGLNFEMGRELLWRGFPTDQQGTWFRNFWGSDAAPTTTPDMDDLRKNPDRTLGEPPEGAPGQQFVLLLRSSLLRRYPNALIYLSDIAGAAPDEFPIFNGSLQPDISFFGFKVSPEAAAGDGTTPGYYVVIQEHPTEPRFGLDPGTLPPTVSHLSIAQQPNVPLFSNTWGRNSAHMAGITRRRPVRIRIRVSQLLTSH